MGELGQRMVDGGGEPDAARVEQWIGARNYRRWMRPLAVKRKPRRA